MENETQGAAVVITVETYFRTIVRGIVYERVQVNDGQVVNHAILNKKDSETYENQAPENSLVGKTKREIGIKRYGYRKYATTKFIIEAGSPSDLPIN